MPSAQTNQSKARSIKKKAVVQKIAAKERTAKPATSTKGGWDEVREFFDDAEVKLEKFGGRVDKATEKMEKGAEKKLQQTQAWFREQAMNLQTAEQKIGRLFDTARVKAHLGKMEATEAAEEMLERVDRLKGRIDSLAAKASTDTADGLKKLSDACLKLRDRLIGVESKH